MAMLEKKKRHFLALGTFCFPAAEEALWVVGAFGFPLAAEERQKGDNSRGKGGESVTEWAA